MENVAFGARIGVYVNTCVSMLWALALASLTTFVAALREILGETIKLFFETASFASRTPSWVNRVCEYFEITYFEFFTWLLSVVLIFSITVLFIRLIRTMLVMAVEFVNISKEVYLYAFGRKISYPRNDDLAVYKYVVEPTIKNEGAYSSRHMKTKVEGTPKGVVQVFVEMQNGELELAGHATYVDGKYVTVKHVIEHAMEDPTRKVFVATLEKPRALEVNILKELARKDIDVAFMAVGSTASILGVKQREASFIHGPSVMVYTFNPDEKCYYAMSCFAEKFEGEELFSAYAILTQSDTHGGDSGLPVLQANKVVAVHKGGCQQKKRNVHVIPVPLIEKLIQKIAGTRKSVLVQQNVLKNESPSIGDNNDDVERAREIKEREEELKQVRQRGEDVDDQGFRKKSAKYVPPKFDSKAWTEIEDEKPDFSPARTPSAVEKKGQQSATRQVCVDQERVKPILRTRSASLGEEPQRMTSSLDLGKQDDLQRLLKSTSSMQKSTKMNPTSEKQMKSQTQEATLQDKPEVSQGQEESRREEIPPLSTSSGSNTQKTKPGLKRKRRLQRLRDQVESLTAQTQNSVTKC